MSANTRMDYGGGGFVLSGTGGNGEDDMLSSLEVS